MLVYLEHMADRYSEIMTNDCSDVVNQLDKIMEEECPQNLYTEAKTVKNNLLTYAKAKNEKMKQIEDTHTCPCFTTKT